MSEVKEHEYLERIHAAMENGLAEECRGHAADVAVQHDDWCPVLTHGMAQGRCICDPSIISTLVDTGVRYRILADGKFKKLR